METKTSGDAVTRFLLIAILCGIAMSTNPTLEEHQEHLIAEMRPVIERESQENLLDSETFGEFLSGIGTKLVGHLAPMFIRQMMSYEDWYVASVTYIKVPDEEEKRLATLGAFGQVWLLAVPDE